MQTCPPHSGTLLQAALVLLLGVIFAFTANSISPNGLDLRRDYFPTAAPQRTATLAESTTSHDPKPIPVAGHEFPTATLEQVVEITRDPRFATRRILIIDAPHTETYRAGHIPGALQLDPFRPEQNLASILPASLAAEKIVIYCTGGDCEDSLLAARLLRDLGVPPARCAIFDGGINAWMAAGQPVQSSP